MGAFRIHSSQPPNTCGMYLIMLSLILFNHTIISVAAQTNQGPVVASFPTVQGQQSSSTPFSSGSSGYGIPQTQSQNYPVDGSVESGDSGGLIPGEVTMPSPTEPQGSQMSNQQQQQSQLGLSGGGQQQQSLNGGFAAGNTNQLNNGLPFQKVNNNNNLNNNNLNNNPFFNGARTKQDYPLFWVVIVIMVVTLEWRVIF